MKAMDAPKPKIMVIEDETLLLDAISKKLAVAGFETISCFTAEQALEKLKDPALIPSLIWLDYYLEGMDGLQFMHQLKQNPSLVNLPVIVVSNSANDEKVHSMLALGVKKYFLKADYRLEDIVQAIRDILSSPS